MKKQELIKKYNGKLNVRLNLQMIQIYKEFIRDLQQLDEPQKVVVPQFVADWYEENKDDFEFNVWDWIAFRNEPKKLENKEFNYWINDGEGNPIQTLVNMHQFVYEVEKEKRYLVKFKGLGHEFRVLKYNIFYKDWFTGSVREDSSLKLHHTRKELEEAGFGWMFDCPGIEIEEVQDET